MVLTYYKSLLSKYFNRGVLVDTNLLLLYFIGKYNVEVIATFKRIQGYTREDFDLLSHILKQFRTILTTPNILTEVCNLSGQFSGKIKNEYFREFKNQIHVLDEKYIPSVNTCDDACFESYGITDIGIVCLAKEKYLVLTDEYRLFNRLQTLGFDVMNFNHIRECFW